VTKPNADATWTTNDGRALVIKWMDSQHIANSINMVIRKNKLRKVDASIMLELANADRDKAGNWAFASMGQELRDRGLFKWGTAADMDGLPPQLERPDMRESFEQLCLIRALIDTGKSWPGTTSFHDAMSCIRYQFESAIVDLKNCVRRQWVGSADASAILIKYVEYRLAPKVNT
jgi:hypothetical protein